MFITIVTSGEPGRTCLPQGVTHTGRRVTKEFIDMMVKEIVKVEKVLREVNGPWRDRFVKTDLEVEDHIERAHR